MNMKTCVQRMLLIDKNIIKGSRFFITELYNCPIGKTGNESCVLMLSLADQFKMSNPSTINRDVLEILKFEKEVGCSTRLVLCIMDLNQTKSGFYILTKFQFFMSLPYY